MNEMNGIRPTARMIRTSKAEDNRPVPATLTYMRSRGGGWACYQNMDKAHLEFGRLTFLPYGPGCQYTTPPERYPDTPSVGCGYRYVHVGYVNLETGEIQDSEGSVVHNPDLPAGG